MCIGLNILISKPQTSVCLILVLNLGFTIRNLNKRETKISVPIFLEKTAFLANFRTTGQQAKIREF